MRKDLEVGTKKVVSLTNVGLTIADAPVDVENGTSFYALDEGEAYLYYNGDWRKV